MKILIIDDSRFLRMANERALTRAGFEVITASDGEEGLSLVREHAPDLVILDMMLPKLSGEGVLKAMREDPRIAATAVMVLTSLPQCNEARLKGDGATSYYQKSLLHLDKGTAEFVEAVERMSLQVKKAKGATAH